MTRVTFWWLVAVSILTITQTVFMFAMITREDEIENLKARVREAREQLNDLAYSLGYERGDRKITYTSTGRGWVKRKEKAK